MSTPGEPNAIFEDDTPSVIFDDVVDIEDAKVDIEDAKVGGEPMEEKVLSEGDAARVLGEILGGSDDAEPEDAEQILAGAENLLQQVLGGAYITMKDIQLSDINDDPEEIKHASGPQKEGASDSTPSVEEIFGLPL